MFFKNTGYTDNVFVPGIESVTLYSRGQQDAFTTSTICRARRKPLSEMQKLRMGFQEGQVWITWEVWRVGSFIEPKIGDSIQDAQGRRSEIKEVEVKSLQNRWECLCLMDTPFTVAG
jgi:hypothetical protein